MTSLYHLDNPIIRCRLRDGGVYRAPSACACGRILAGIEVATIGRTDAVRKIQGINVYPQAVDGIVFSRSGVEEYRVKLSSAPNHSDVARLVVMLSDDILLAERGPMIEAISHDLRVTLGIRFIVEPGRVERSEYKARRWTDTRVR